LSKRPEQPGSFKAWLRSADEYCFGMTSPTTLGVFRIGFSFFLLMNWLMIAIDWDAWFSERGYIPAWLGSLWFGDKTPLGFHTGILIPRINLLAGITDPRITIPFYIANIVFTFLTCIGLGTRLSSLLMAICTVTLQHRNGAILHGGDTVMRVMALYIAITPCGRACSLDRLIAQWRAKSVLPLAKVSFWGQRVIAYNVALIYFTTVWLKWDGDKWRHLIATYYPERLAEFYRFPYPDFIKSLWMARVATLGTILVEFSLGTLVFFKPTRKYAILGGVLMHVYIEYTMNIPLFSFLMITTYVIFFEGEEISGFFERAGLRLRRWHVVLRYPAGMRLQPRVAGFLQAVDPLRMISYLPGETPEWTASTLDGKPARPFAAILKRCPGIWVFAVWPGFRRKLLVGGLEPLQATGAAEPVPAAERPISGKTSR